MFEKTCALVLVALGDKDWKGRYMLDKDETTELRNQVEEVSKNKRGPFARQDDRISLLELRDFADDPANKEIILKHGAALHGLGRVEFVEQVFKQYDKDNSKFLDAEEWHNFLQKLAHLNLEYFLQVSFQDFRAFYGRHQPWDLGQDDLGSSEVIEVDLMRASGSFGESCGIQKEEESTLLSEKTPRSFQYGRDPDCKGWNPIPQGWWKDFHYYSANNHPLHGIFMCDPYHPLSWIERVWMEVATVGFSTLTSVLHERWVTDELVPSRVAFLSQPFAFSLVMVTIPGMIIWWTLFLLFTCKCGHVNKAGATPEEERKAWWLRVIGATLAYILCAIGLACLVEFFIKFDYKTRDVRHFLKIVVMGRIKSWIIFWCLMLFIYFNPFLAWGTTNPDEKQSGIGDLIGLGQWRIEKQRFQVKCVRVSQKEAARQKTKSQSSLKNEE